MSVIGEPLDRVDGRAKITGAAIYSAAFQIAGVVYGALIQSTIASGRIATINKVQAEQTPGVLAILVPGNASKLPAPEERLSLLQDDAIHYNNQLIQERNRQATGGVDAMARSNSHGNTSS